MIAAGKYLQDRVGSQGGDLAAMILRVSLGLMYLAHGVLLKFFTFGMDNTVAYFESVGLPGPLAYIVFTMELVGGLLLLAGVATRWVALALSPILLGATWIHSGNGWVFSAANGGWEYPVFLLVASAAVFLLGNGSFSVTNLKKSAEA